MNDSISTTSNNTDGQPSDMGYILRTIEMAFELYCRASSESARSGILVSLCAEAAMLRVKLGKTLCRWGNFLPFKESIDVNFGTWSDTIRAMLPTLGDEDVESVEPKDLFMPSKGYLMDLMDVELEHPELDDAEGYLSKIDRLLRRMDMSAWETKTLEKLEYEIRSQLDRLESHDTLRALTLRTLRALSDDLKTLHDFFSSELSEYQFRMLARRLHHRNTVKMTSEAAAEVTKELTLCPITKRKEYARQRKEELREELAGSPFGAQLGEYLNLDYPELFEEACYGQFVFRYRHQLTLEELNRIVKICTEITELNRFIDPKGRERRKEEAAKGRQLTDEERDIVKRLLQLAERGEWRGTTTTDSIKLGINRMLGVGFELDSEMRSLSEDLWSMLKKRRNLDADHSLQATWLNVVGWCVRQGLLSGGAPKLCKQFFPRAYDRDYNCILKGKDGEPASFKKVWPLLEKYLR